MRYEPTPNESASLHQLSQEERFFYAMSRMVECEEVWSLGDEASGWLIRDMGETQAISIWPYRVLAETFARGESGAITLSISLEHFMYGVLDKCHEAEIMIEVAPDAQTPGRLMPAAALFEVLNGMVEAGEYFIEG